MKKPLLALLIFLGFFGCKQIDLHHNLEETEASEILVLLQQNGIEAKKEREVSGQEVSWKVSIREVDAARSRQILIANNLPRRRELGLSGVYKEKGLIPTPDEQKARFLLALKGEIINSLQRIPGVVDADVVLNVPTENEFAELDPEKKRPTASVVVKTRNDAVVAQTVTEGKVQQFVANSVPNLNPNDVTVIVTRADTGSGPIPVGPVGTSPGPEGLDLGDSGGSAVAGASLVELAGMRLEPESVGRFKFYIISLLALLMGVSMVLLVNIMRLNRLRLRFQRGGRADRASLGAPQGASLLGEGHHQGAGAMEGTFDVGAGQKQRL